MSRNKIILVILVILVALSIVFVACGSGDGNPTATFLPGPTELPAPTPRPTPTAFPTPTAIPAPTARPAPTPLPTSTPLSVQAGDFRLTILHNNDGESQLVNLGIGLEGFGGVTQFAAVVNREKELAASVGNIDHSGLIMVSSGDNFLAGPEFTIGVQSGTFYDAVAIDLIGYDAIALGNHDFDLGPDVLANFISQVSASRATFLSANLDFSDEPVLQSLVDRRRIAASVVVQKSGERIGIIGATTPEIRTISSPRDIRIISDVAGRVQAEVNRLESSGVNKIILISHLQGLDADLELISQLRGVDVVVAGGGDELLANECDLLIPDGDAPTSTYPIVATSRDGVRVPVVTTAGQYSYLGKLVVTFDVRGDLLGVDADSSGPVRIAREDDPATVRANFDDCRSQIRFRDSLANSQMQRDVVNPIQDGFVRLAQPIATSQVALEGRRSVVRFEETNLGNLMADAMRWKVSRLAPEWGARPPDVALQNGGAIRIDLLLRAGQVRELDTFDMAPFANLLTVVEDVSRSQFKEVLENAVSRAVDGDAGGGTGRFMQVSGFKFEWSRSGIAQSFRPDGSVNVPGTRVQRVVLDDGTVVVGGGRVVPGSTITVATTDFVARGGDEYNFRGAPFTVLGVQYQQGLAEYIRVALNARINESDYPEGGEGRIKQLP